ncbi:hypothetical protein DFH08DRAFT_982829 [Mycena albidolilacea]|uniref:Protein kinase domain-containing protein n=1 Tax=Mycena albidolilacea TaxID=1033008 RepID=A0AAD7AV33_9AGAR|nr:hypothetical protein DFH08DRAFT_982829 [Mycena albidolilacea]
MGNVSYETLGKGDDNIPPAALDPFHPTDTENFAHHFWPPKDLLSARSSNSWQPAIEICFAIDRHQRSVVLKAVPDPSPELKVLRMLSGSPLREDKRNRAIPVLEFVETAHDFVIAIMPVWGICWDSPPCGNMKTRGELAMKRGETLQFFHENGVAHGDIHPFNIVINHVDSRKFSEPTAQYDFRDSFNCEYVYIDYGSAHTFPPGTPAEKALNEILDIDLFAADIYNLGKTLERENFVRLISNMATSTLIRRDIRAYCRR